MVNNILDGTKTEINVKTLIENLDETAKDQLYNIANSKVYEDADIAIMPDVPCVPVAVKK